MKDDYTGASFDGKDLSRKDLCGNFTGATFVGTTLIGADLRCGIFLDADFTRANLQGARVNIHQLEQQVSSLHRAIMPNDSIHP